MSRNAWCVQNVFLIVNTVHVLLGVGCKLFLNQPLGFTHCYQLEEVILSSHVCDSISGEVQPVALTCVSARLECGSSMHFRVDLTYIDTLGLLSFEETNAFNHI